MWSLWLGGLTALVMLAVVAAYPMLIAAVPRLAIEYGLGLPSGMSRVLSVAQALAYGAFLVGLILLRREGRFRTGRRRSARRRSR